MVQSATQQDREEIFREMSPGRAILTLTIPTIIAQLITIIYTIADLFYVGQLGDPAQLAGVRIAFPPFLLLTALANLYGIGAASAIGRALGAGNPGKAGECSAFAFWAGCLTAVVYAVALEAAKPWVLPWLGAAAETYEPTAIYLTWVIGLGALPQVASNVLAHMVRSEGYAKVAGRGIALGGVLNILIAPVFIFWLRMEIAGAAVAVFISNLVSALYMLWFVLVRGRGATVLRLSPGPARRGVRHAGEILSVGASGFVMTGMASVSNGALNFLAASYGAFAVAGLGIAKQIDQLIFTCSIGLGQGALPLIAYNFASGNFERLRSVVKTAAVGGVSCSLLGSAFLVLCSDWITAAFIDDAETVAYASACVCIIAIACPLSIIGHLNVSGFQACRARWQALVLAFLRKGGSDIPLMFLFAHMFGLYGIAAAIPAAELLSVTLGLLMSIPFLKRLGKENTIPN